MGLVLTLDHGTIFKKKYYPDLPKLRSGYSKKSNNSELKIQPILQGLVSNINIFFVDPPLKQYELPIKKAYNDSFTRSF